MAQFFTADLHLGHRAVIEYAGRPFASVEVMDAELIRRWNVVVGPEDEVWLLGDVGFYHPKRLTPLVEQLRGTIHLVAGNHDPRQVRRMTRWATVQDDKELKNVPRANGLVARVVLCHYPFATWKNAHHGALHFHGHSHGNLPGDARRQDVGVDCWDYAPVGLDEILARMADPRTPAWAPVDHHR